MAKDRLLKTAVILMAVGIVGISGTTWLGAPSMSPSAMFKMTSGRLPPGIKPEDLPEPDSSGAQLVARYCVQCHNIPSPGMHTAEEWPNVEVRMFSRMRKMTGMKGAMGGMRMRGMMNIQAPAEEEESVILAYLQHHALKPASLEMLGPTDAPGLALFRRICSQCHALPDPKLHRTEEWPAVVERMRKNVDIMGKAVITENEKSQIVSYLNEHAR